MIEIVRERVTPGELRDLLAEAGIDVRSTSWDPGFVVAGGRTYAPTLLRGVLYVDGIPHYSEAWL